jgi:Helix-turn-helix domain
MGEDTLNLGEAAEFLGVSERKMWQMAKAREIETFLNPLDKREKLFRRKDLLKLRRPMNGNKAQVKEAHR